MSAAITGAEKCKIYELLNAIDDTAAAITNGFSVVLAISDLNIKTQIDAKILALGNDEIDRVRVILGEYDNVAFDTGSMENGSAGNVSGLSQSAGMDVMNLRQKMLTYIPVMSYAESIKRRNDTNSQASSPSTSIPFLRG